MELSKVYQLYLNNQQILAVGLKKLIARGAISEDVLKDVALFYNHDLNTKPHARTRNKRLSFSIENDGVHMQASVNLERSDSKDFT